MAVRYISLTSLETTRLRVSLNEQSSVIRRLYDAESRACVIAGLITKTVVMLLVLMAEIKLKCHEGVCGSGGIAPPIINQVKMT
jgi:hypothetical protein